MSTKKELISQLLSIGISKGLSRLKKEELQNLLIQKSNLVSVEERKKQLQKITKNDLIKIILEAENKKTQRTLASLSHQILMDKVASKYWNEFLLSKKSLKKESQKKVSQKQEEEKKKIKEFLQFEFRNNKGFVPYKKLSSNSNLAHLFTLSVLKRSQNDCHLKDKFVRVETSNKKIVKFSDKDFNDILSSYIRCQEKKKFLIVPLAQPSHLNMLIFNHRRKEIERFEPHGAQTLNMEALSSEIDQSIQKKIVDPMNKKLPKNEQLTYIPPSLVCPKGFMGYQAYEQQAKKKTKDIRVADPNGYCVAWSYFYALLRLKFPDMPASELIKESFKTLSTNPKKLRTFISGQVKDYSEMLLEFLKKKGFKEKDWFYQLQQLVDPKYGNKQIQKDFEDFLKEKFKSFTV